LYKTEGSSVIWEMTADVKTDTYPYFRVKTKTQKASKTKTSK